MIAADAQTLEALEFSKVLALAEREVRFPPAAEIVRELRPSSDPARVAASLSLTDQARAFLERHGDLPWEGLEDVRSLSSRARKGGMLLTGELLRVERTVSALCRLGDFLLRRTRHLELLRELAPDPAVFRDLGELLRRSLDPEKETLRDDASPILFRLRRKRRRLEALLRRAMEETLRSPEVTPFLQEHLYTFREGRAVLPVRRDFRHRLPGVVRGYSQSGETVFLEPARAVAYGNALDLVRRREEAEEQAVLLRLSRAVGERGKEIEEALSRLALLDAAMSRARLSLKWKARRPEAAASWEVRLLGARHPLLGERAVPQDLLLGGEGRLLLITGPNTGGKTVSLKTLGLMVLLHQAGFHLPVEEGSRLSVFRRVWADIGDEQSIEQNLSTFSGHAVRLIRVLEEAEEGDLVILDELGAGTDPEEGAALGIAALEYLLGKGPLVAASTHLGEIKLWAASSSGVRTAALEFDSKSLAPTFRLLYGRPGWSHAFEVASSLGMPESVLRRAREVRGGERGALREVLGRLEEEVRRLEEERRELGRLREEAERLGELWRRRLGSLRQAREEILERWRREWREAREEMGRVISLLRREGGGEEARRRMESLAPPALPRVAERAPRREWRPGDPVWVSDLSSRGEFVRWEEEGRRAVVALGSLRALVGAESLFPVEGGGEKATPSPPPVTFPRPEVPPEIHLRRMRIEEALARLEEYLDRAFLAGLEEVRVVHGKGEGILRRAVAEFLSRHPQVESFRMGEGVEGGLGVTVVRLRQ